MELSKVDTSSSANPEYALRVSYDEARVIQSAAKLSLEYSRLSGCAPNVCEELLVKAYPYTTIMAHDGSIDVMISMLEAAGAVSSPHPMLTPNQIDLASKAADELRTQFVDIALRHLA